MDLREVCSKLDVPITKVVNAYVVGSRLWGSAHATSDWDLIIVTRERGEQGAAHAVHKAMFDAKVMSLVEYTARLRAHRMPELATVWAPEPCIMRQTVEPTSLFTIDVPSLRAATMKDAEKAWKRIAKSMARGDVNVAKKVTIASVRYSMLAVQVAETGRIHSYTCANAHRMELLNNYACTFETLEEEYHSIVRTNLAMLEEDRG